MANILDIQADETSASVDAIPAVELSSDQGSVSSAGSIAACPPSGSYAAEIPDAAVVPTTAGGVLVSATAATPATAIGENPSLVKLRHRAKPTAQAIRLAAICAPPLRLAISKKHGKVCMVTPERGYLVVLPLGSAEADALIRSRARAAGEVVKKRDVAEISDELRSMAEEDGIEIDLYARVAPKDGGGIEIDVNDGLGTTVEIDSSGVQIKRATSRIFFLRTSTSLPLQIPVANGRYDLMKAYVNLDAASFMLYIAWVSYTIAHPKVESTKYVFLVFKGTQGSGKSFASKATQKLVDPSTTGAQTMPASPRDLAIVSQAANLLVFDNLRDLSPAMSDALCIAATGGTVAMRQLYTDDSQKNLYLHSAILFNGIHPFMGQSDFADRCLVLNLNPLPAQERKTEGAMLAQFESDYPVILGGLYELIASIFKALPEATVTSPSRMLGFCHWIAGMEVACGMPQGVLQSMYDSTVQEMQLETLQDNPLASAILGFAEKMPDPQWSGTPSDFYEEIERFVSYSGRKSQGWPSNAATMSKRIHGLQAPLLAQGIEIWLERGKDRKVVMRKLGNWSPAPETSEPGDSSDSSDGSVGKSMYSDADF